MHRGGPQIQALIRVALLITSAPSILPASFLQSSEDSSFQPFSPIYSSAGQLTCVIIGYFNRFYYLLIFDHINRMQVR